MIFFVANHAQQFSYFLVGAPSNIPTSADTLRRISFYWISFSSIRERVFRLGVRSLGLRFTDKIFSKAAAYSTSLRFAEAFGAGELPFFHVLSTVYEQLNACDG
jgi:hypothetical protein